MLIDLLYRKFWQSGRRLVFALACLLLFPLLVVEFVIGAAVSIGAILVMGTFALCWRIGEFNRDRRAVGLTFPEALGHEFELWWFALYDDANAACRRVREWLRGLFKRKPKPKPKPSDPEITEGEYMPPPMRPDTPNLFDEVVR